MAARNVWTDNETRQLILLWGDARIQAELDDFSVRNDAVHRKLSDSMKEKGFNRDAKQIKTKIKHLREVYRKHKDNINRSGAEAGKPPKFFEEIDVILVTRPQTQPPFVIDSGEQRQTDEAITDLDFDNDSEGSSTTTLNGTSNKHLFHIPNCAQFL